VMTLLFVVLPPMLVSDLGFGLSGHWKIYVPAMIGSVLVMFPILRRVGANHSERKLLPRAFLLLALGMGLVPLSVVTLSPGLAVLGMLLSIYFLGFNLLEAAMPALLSRLTGSRGRGRRMGIYSTFQFLGAFVGGVGGGWLLSGFGSQAALLAAAVACLAWGTALKLLSKRFFLTREAD